MRWGLCLCLAPGVAFACALPPSVVMTLPTGWYMVGAALTVGLTAILGGLAGRLPGMGARLLWQRRVLVPETLSSYLGFLGFAGLIGIGFLGSTDPMHNLLTLIFWTGVWVALPLASMVFGNLWRCINPWTAPVRMARMLAP